MFCRFSQGELETLDSEGRVIMTDHGAFVLVNVYGPAISTEDSAEERYAFKLQFYKVALQKANTTRYAKLALRPVVPDCKVSADSADASQCVA